MTPASDEGLRLVPLGRHDRGLVRSWLAKPEVQAWWGSSAAAEAEIAIALDSESAICRMIEAGGDAVGYAHAIDQSLLDESRDDAGTWCCGFMIGSDAHRGRGLGVAALKRLTAEVFSTTLALACEVRVPVRNEAAVRAIEAVGFRWVRVEGSASPMWAMKLDRPAR